uniref:NADH:ubiquinone reductase (H(+)-translocating) n=1 Tax=Histiostomatidae sp. XFX TaxID=2652661 RepID=A0A5J6VD97_9ACAR|nr:NADH dehydrogenase subunit 5 [Histiostomatidae sp. XFX]
MFFFFFSFFLFISYSMMLLSVYLINYNCFIIDIFFTPLGFTEVSFSFCFDYVSLFFFSIVSLISAVVFFYSKFYMDIDEGEGYMNFRFLSVLFLFVISMFFLVFSYSWVSLMMGWDGLGMVSFLLVIFYNNPKSLNSGLITVFTNRLGDCLFILSFISMYMGGCLSFGFLAISYSFLFCFFLMIGAITKSAQAPFSSWLPAAMAAPTPVSSLVHSSTLVTAGVYVILRFGFLFEEVFYVLSFISLFTMFVAGVCSMLEFDFKKVVAMSTLSQLGFMLFSISIGLGSYCFMHMMFHAFFKSMLFLSTGSFMHLMSGDQDYRFFGSLSDSFFSKCFFNCSCLSLMGMPFTLGFYSKDFILSYSSFMGISFFFIIFFVSCCFTVAYSLRLIYMSSFLFPSFFPSFSFGESKVFYIPVFVLFMFCVLVGNFFMMYFFPVSIFSFFDFFTGLLAISMGVSLFFIFNTFYSLKFFLSGISFMSYIFSGGVSSNFKRFSFVDDMTWLESAGGKGSMHLLSSGTLYISNIFSISFWSLPVSFMLLVFYFF